MRLVFMDEIMAKRNISSSVMNDLVDARQEIELLKKHLAEATKQYDYQLDEVRQLRVELQSLGDRHASVAEQNRGLTIIPQLQQDLRRVELERDDAVTKLLTLQLDVNAERQMFQTTISDLESKLQRLTSDTAATIAMKEDTIVAERLAHEARVHSLNDAADQVKSDLRAMLEQRSEALHSSEREADRYRAELSSMEVDVTTLRRTATQHLDTIDELQRHLQERDLELRRGEMRAHDAQYQDERRTATLETQLHETEKTLASSEDMLVVYKRALQYALDLLRGGTIIHTGGAEAADGPSSPALSPPRNGGAGVPFVLSPILASRLPGSSTDATNTTASSPVRRESHFDDAASPHVVKSNGAVVMASVLKNAIDDSARTGHQEQQRLVQQVQGVLQRQLASLASEVESLHVQQLTKLRRLSNRIADAGDVAELCSRRQTKFHLRLRNEMNALVSSKEVVEAELKSCRQHLRAAAEDHESLHIELRRNVSEREVERQAWGALQVFLDEVGGNLQSDVRRAAEETRQSVVQVRLINPEFLEGIKAIVRKSHATVQQVHDLVDVAQRQYHQLVVSGGAGSTAPSPSHYGPLPSPLSAHSLLNGRSPSMASRSGGAAGDAPKPALTVENLIQQLVNVCQLLENNIQQGKQSEERLTDSLKSWEVKLTKEWTEVERRIVSSLAPVRRTHANPTTIPSDSSFIHSSSYRQPSQQQQQQQPFIVHRSSSYQRNSSDDVNYGSGASFLSSAQHHVRSTEPSPAPMPAAYTPTPLVTAPTNQYIDPANAYRLTSASHQQNVQQQQQNATSGAYGASLPGWMTYAAALSK
ncbi:Hypothetical protein, putative [Bodo saltans]|uniref:Uncharacterized protein n=1 Tax=Bodo saltans TaxID=75058 RepID=A0A0S4J7L3_BODSA|nr:Hypothetical protein, putative [Bodo saltans]|eukprot:CUG86302.1 Hypothetical protein, putative [Bodo saltans]